MRQDLLFIEVLRMRDRATGRAPPPFCGRKMKDDRNTGNAMYDSTPIAENQGWVHICHIVRPATSAQELRETNPQTKHPLSGWTD